MTKFDETVVQSFVNWALRGIGFINGGRVRAELNRDNREQVLVKVPKELRRPRTFEAELNRRFRVMEAVYRATLDGPSRCITVARMRPCCS